MSESLSWNEARLQELITDGTEENLQLEYKGAAALKKENKSKEEITRDVSAMANSAGGIIIYGIAEDHTKRVPERIDPIDPAEFPKEWLEQIINRIQPRIHGVKVESVNLGANKDRVAYWQGNLGSCRL